MNLTALLEMPLASVVSRINHSWEIHAGARLNLVPTRRVDAHILMQCF